MMMIQEAARALHTDWGDKDVFFTGVSTDSRTIRQGDLFVALSGNNFDGNQFVSSAAEKGAVAAMIGQQVNNNIFTELPLLRVKDTRLGLGQLAAYWRERFTLPMIGVTGSNGKTTVKEMIACILRQAVIADDEVSEDDAFTRVLATEGNLNNDIGVPQMLLRLREQHQYAVIEMGMNHVGEISYLTKLTKPNVAVITNAGAAHIEGLGTVETVAQAKGEIFEGLDQQGVVVINADDTYASLWRQLAGTRPVVDFGLNSMAQVSAQYQTNALSSKIDLKLPSGVEEVNLNVPGAHNIRNALAASAVAIALNINEKTIVSGLESFKGVRGRMQKKLGLRQATLIDDTYNANPESVRAALTFLAETEGKKIMVLGDMGELGQAAVELHRAVGKEARHAGIDRLLTLGELSAYAVEAFGVGAQHFNSLETLLGEIEHLLAADVTLLVKGSRFMQMERVIRHFEA